MSDPVGLARHENEVARSTEELERRSNQWDDGYFVEQLVDALKSAEQGAEETIDALSKWLGAQYDLSHREPALGSTRHNIWRERRWRYIDRRLTELLEDTPTGRELRRAIVAEGRADE